jgi:hypothetical protein
MKMNFAEMLVLIWSMPVMIVAFGIWVLWSGWEHEDQREQPLVLPVFLVAFVLLAAYMNKYADFTSWYTVAYYTVGYIVAGIVWSVVKWVRFLRKAKDIYIEYAIEYDDYLNYVNGPRAQGTYMSAPTLPGYFNKPGTSTGNVPYTVDESRPLAKYNKRRIISWMIYWPSSILWFVLHDFVTYIFDCMRGVYDSIAKKVY